MSKIAESYFDDNGTVHREGGPAIVYANGDQVWYRHGHIHREDGPAVISTDGERFWMLNDRVLGFNRFCDKLNLSSQQKMLLVLRYNP